MPLLLPQIISHVLTKRIYISPRRTILILRQRVSLKSLRILRKYIENIHIISILRLYGLNFWCHQSLEMYQVFEIFDFLADACYYAHAMPYKYLEARPDCKFQNYLSLIWRYLSPRWRGNKIHVSLVASLH